MIIANVFVYKTLSDKKMKFEDFMNQIEDIERNGNFEEAIRTIERKDSLNQQTKEKLNDLRYKLLDTYIANNDYEKQVSLTNKLIQNNPDDENLKNILQEAKTSIEKREKAIREEQERIAKEKKAKEEVKNKYNKIVADNSLTDSRDISDYRVEVYENMNKEKSFYVITKDNSGNILKIFNPTYPDTYKKGEGDIMEIKIARFDKSSSQYYILIGVKDKNYYSEYNQSSTSKRKYYYYKISKENLQAVKIGIDQPFRAKDEDVKDGYRIVSSKAWSEPLLLDNEKFDKAETGPSNRTLDFILKDGDYYELYYHYIICSNDENKEYIVVFEGFYVFEDGRFKIDKFGIDYNW